MGRAVVIAAMTLVLSCWVLPARAHPGPHAHHERQVALLEARLEAVRDELVEARAALGEGRPPARDREEVAVGPTGAPRWNRATGAAHEARRRMEEADGITRRAEARLDRVRDTLSASAVALERLEDAVAVARSGDVVQELPGGPPAPVATTGDGARRDGDRQDALARVAVLEAELRLLEVKRDLAVSTLALAHGRSARRAGEPVDLRPLEAAVRWSREALTVAKAARALVSRASATAPSR